MTAGTHPDKNEGALRAHSEPARSWVLPRVLRKIRKALPLRAARRRPEPRNKT